jgi:hypothetical protein
MIDRLGGSVDADARVSLAAALDEPSAHLLARLDLDLDIEETSLEPVVSRLEL